MEVARRGKQPKDMFIPPFGVFLSRNGRHVAEIELVAQFGLVFVLVDGDDVRAQDEVDGLPRLGLARALEEWARLDDFVEIVAAVDSDRRAHVQRQFWWGERGHGRRDDRSRLRAGLHFAGGLNWNRV